MKNKGSRHKPKVVWTKKAQILINLSILPHHSESMQVKDPMQVYIQPSKWPKRTGGVWL